MHVHISKLQSILGQGNVLVEKVLWETNSLLIVLKTKNSLRDIIIKFKGVVHLDIRTGPYEIFSLIGLQLKDITDYQMEGKKYKITSEDDTSYLFFYCDDFEILDNFEGNDLK